MRLLIVVTTVFLIALLLANVGAQSGDVDQQKERLKKIQQDIERHRAEAQDLRREEKNAMKQLNHLDREIALSKKLLAGLEEREKFLEHKIDSLSVSVVHEEAMLNYQKEKLGKRVREMYKRGPSFQWEVLISSADMQEVVRKYKFLEMMAERDAGLVHEVSTRKLELQTEQAALTEAMADVVALKNLRSDEMEKLERTKKRRKVVLAGIRTEKSKHTQAISELERAQREVQDLIDRLERNRVDDDYVPDVEFAKLKGRLIWPVDGKVTKKFGNERHPQFGTVIFNNGINIKAKSGSPIRAVASGKVEFVDWISGYGNCIILNHGDGYYTLYAHVDAIFVRSGQRVAAKDVIAEVGDTGSLNGYECHFEVRKSKQALNPLDWLKK